MTSRYLFYNKIEGTFGLRLSQGVGGAVELAPGYLKLVYDIVRKAGGVCIADEVQTGFGRTGSHYWGFETQGVIPDIVTMAKVFLLLGFLIVVYMKYTWPSA